MHTRGSTISLTITLLLITLLPYLLSYGVEHGCFTETKSLNRPDSQILTRVDQTILWFLWQCWTESKLAHHSNSECFPEALKHLVRY